MPDNLLNAPDDVLMDYAKLRKSSLPADKPRPGAAVGEFRPPPDDLRAMALQQRVLIGGDAARMAMFPDEYADDPEERQGIWERGARGIAYGIASQIPLAATYAGAVLEFMGADEAGEDLAENGLSLQDWLENHVAVENPKLFDHLMTGVGTLATFLAPGIGAGLGASRLALGLGMGARTAEGAIKLSKAGSIFSKLTGSGAMSFLEAGAEQAQRQQELMADGMSPAEALKASEAVFWQNVPLLMTTNLGFWSPGSRIARAALGFVTEGVFQERGQSVIQDVAAGRGTWTDFWDPSKHQTATLVGGIIGSGAQLVLPAEGGLPEVGEKPAPDETPQDAPGSTQPQEDPTAPAGLTQEQEQPAGPQQQPLRREPSLEEIGVYDQRNAVAAMNREMSRELGVEFDLQDRLSPSEFQEVAGLAQQAQRELDAGNSRVAYDLRDAAYDQAMGYLFGTRKQTAQIEEQDRPDAAERKRARDEQRVLDTREQKKRDYRTKKRAGRRDRALKMLGFGGEDVSFTNEDEGVTAFAMEGENGWTVQVLDDDSGEVLPTYKMFPVEQREAAARYAEALAMGQELPETAPTVEQEQSGGQQTMDFNRPPADQTEQQEAPAPQQQEQREAELREVEKLENERLRGDIESFRAIHEAAVESGSDYSKEGIALQKEIARLQKRYDADQMEQHFWAGVRQQDQAEPAKPTGPPTGVEDIKARAKEQAKARVPQDQATEPGPKPSPNVQKSAKVKAAGGRWTVYNVPMDQVTFAEDDMQNREGAFSEKTAASVAERYDEATFDPVDMWRNPDTGELVMIEGHSRYEGMRRRGSDTIPAFIHENMTYEEAKKLAREKNKSRDVGNIVDDVKLYRNTVEAEGLQTKSARERRSKDLFGKNASTVRALANLKPDGQVMSTLRSLAESSDAELNRFMDIARWIGKAREAFPQLTDAHEQEMFDDLRKNYGQGRAYQNQNNYLQLIESRTQVLGFDPSQSLNLANAQSRSPAQRTYDALYAEAKRAHKEAKAVLEAKTDEFKSAGMTGQDLYSALKKYEDDVTLANREEMELKKRGNNVGRNNTGEQTMFLKDGSVSEWSDADVLSERVFNPKIVAPKGADFDMLRRIAKRFGVRIVFFESADKVGGFHAKNDRGRIFINVREGQKYPALFVLGHEIGHWMELVHPEAFEKIRKIISDQLAMPKAVKLVNYFAALRESGYSDTGVYNEIPADVIGTAFTSEKFWDALEKADRPLWRDLLAKVRSILAATRAAIVNDPRDMTQYFKDFAAIENVVTEQFAKLSARERENIRQKAPAGQDELFPPQQGTMFLKEGRDGKQIMQERLNQREAVEKGRRDRRVKSGIDLFRTIYKKMIDRNTWLYVFTKRALDAAGRNYWSEDSSSLPDKVLQRFAAWTSHVDQNLRQVVLSFDGTEKLSDGLQVIIKRFGLAKAIASGEFGQFMTAARMRSMYEVLGERYFTGEDEALDRSLWSDKALQAEQEYLDYQAIYDEYATKEWVAAVKAMSDWSNAIMKRVVQSGMMSQEQYDKMVGKYGIYAPLYVLEKETAARGKVAYEMDRLIPGQTRMDPIDGMIKNAYKLEFLLQNNYARLKATEFVRDLSGGQDSLENYGAKVPKLTIDEYVEDFIEKSGLDRESLTDEALESIRESAKLFATAEYQDGKTIAIMRDGEVEFWEFEPDILDVYTNVAARPTHDLMKFFTVQTRLLRAGAVLTPEFMARNQMRDFLSAGVLAQNLVNNPKDAALLPIRILRAVNVMVDFKGSLKNRQIEFKDSQDWIDFIDSGAGHAELVALDQENVRKKSGDLLRETGPEFRRMKMKQGPLKYLIHSHPLRLLQELSKVTENTTRLAVFIKTRDDLMAQGVSREEAKAKAAIEAREGSTDFSRAGEYALVLNKMLPFFNASLQGNDVMMRRLFRDKGNRGATWARGAMMVTLPSVALWALNHDEDWYKEQPLWLKNMFWLFSIDGGKTIHKIPKPFEIGLIFGSLPERFLDWKTEKDPKAMASWVEQYKRAVFTLDPAALLGPTFTSLNEARSNYDAFRGTPIVKGWLQKVEAQQQYTASTSEFAKWLGSLGPGSGISPLKIDHVIRGSLGGIGQWGAEIASNVIMMADPKRRDLKPSSRLIYGAIPEWVPVLRGLTVSTPATYTRQQDDFFERYDKATEAVNTLAAFKAGGASKEDFLDLYRRSGVDIAMHESLSRAGAALGKISKQIRAVQAAPQESLSRDEKRKKIDELIRARTKLMDKYMARLKDLDEKALQKKIDQSIDRVGRQFDEGK